jgi:anaerobic magnesium-protoporphyrin IX monomethyl ester cyclase
MAKLLLINPSYNGTYGSTVGNLATPIYPVMSLSTLAGEARRAGHDVSICDLSFQRYDPQVVYETIRNASPDVVGITATTPLANQMQDIAYIAKSVSRGITTVAGGAHATALKTEVLRRSALDIAVYGEGDQTIVDILAGKPPAEIDGVCYGHDGDFKVTRPRHMVEDLDDLAMPAWDLYPMEKYRSISRLIAKRPPVSSIEFSRGCVYKCDFCASKNTMGLGYRKKSPARCAEEMLFLQRLGYREVILADDIFTSDNNWAAAVCEEFIRRDVKLLWTCTNGIRVDSANGELFRLMRRAGCYRVHFGFESGNDEVLRKFGKGGKATLDQGETAVDKARDAGLQTFGMFMLGLTGDTAQTMQDTIDYAKRVKVDAMRFGITVPFPGTKMFDELHKVGLIKSYNWDLYTVYNDAAQLFSHPDLKWETVIRYFHKSHFEAYVLNPRYIVRRLISSIRSGELFWDMYYFLKLNLLLVSRRKHTPNEEYRFRQHWEKLELTTDQIVYEDPPVAKGVSRRLVVRPTSS